MFGQRLMPRHLQGCELELVDADLEEIGYNLHVRGRKELMRYLLLYALENAALKTGAM